MNDIENLKESIDSLSEIISQIQSDVNDIDNKSVNNLSAALQDIQKEINDVYDALISVQNYCTYEVTNFKNYLSEQLEIFETYLADKYELS